MTIKLRHNPVNFVRTVPFILASFLVGALLISSTNSVTAINVVEDFESTISKKDFVNYGDNADFSQTKSRSEAYNSSGALKIVSRNSHPGSMNLSELTRWITYIDRYETTPGERITASARLKAQSVKEKGLLAISFFKDKGRGSWGDAWISTASSSQSVTGNTDWEKISLTVDAPKNAKYVRYEFRLFDTGTMLIDDFTIRDNGMDIDIDENKNLVVYETPSKTGSEYGAQVVLGNKDFIWVDAACKSKLVADGNQLATKTFTELDSSFNRLRTNSLDCLQIRSYSPSDDIQELISEPVSGPGEVISAEEPANGANPEAIAYVAGAVDTSVIPEDSVVRTGLFGINKGSGQQLFTVDCKHSHFKSDDPIVFPNELGRSHNHEFFGDTHLDANSTIESIISNPANTCDVGGDRSAYWTPTAIQDGKVLEADNNKFYYKVGRVNPKDIIPMPTGLRMLAGNANATGPQSPQVVYLFATTSEGKHTEPHTQSTRNGGMFTINERENGVRLQLHFPQCWDGENLWLPNSVHMAYAENGGCPDSHPNAFLQLQYNLGYSDATGGNGFRFSSGPWYTAHGDFVNGWRPETMERLVQTCIREKRYCGLTKSAENSVPCASKPSKTRGCIEFRAGETFPRFFGKTFN